MATFTVNKATATPMRTITFKSSTPSSSPRSTSNSSARPAVSTPTPTKTIQFKSSIVPTPSQSISFKTTPATKVTTATPQISVELAAALRNFEDNNKPIPTVEKTIQFQTGPVEKPSQTLGAFSSVSAASALSAPQLSDDIHKTVQSLVKAANETANVIASRTDKTWDTNATAAEKILITNKIQDALISAQQTRNPVLNFNNFITNQLTGMNTVAKASVNVATSRAGMAAAQNNADAANALNLIAKLASYGMKSATSAVAAHDVKEMATQSTNHVMGVTTAANATINQDHAAIVASIGKFVKNNIDVSLESKQALATPTKTITFKTALKAPDLAAAVKKLTSKPVLPTVTKVIEFNKTPATKYTIKTLGVPVDSDANGVSKAIYTSMYGNKPQVGAEVVAERYGAILNVVKKEMGPGGKISEAKLQSIQDSLSQRLVVQASEFVSEVKPDTLTPQQKVDQFNRQADILGLNKPQTPAKKTVLPGSSSTTDQSQAVLGESQSPEEKSKAAVKLTPVAAAAAQTAKPTTGAPTNIDPTKTYKTKSGNIMLGKDIQPSDRPYITGLAPDISQPMPPSTPSTAAHTEPIVSKTSIAAKIMAAKNIFGKPITAVSPVTKIISFTPAGMKNVVGSDGKRAVKIDTDIYNGLKQTYKDDQIADLLSDARLGVFVDEKAGNVKIGQVANQPKTTFTEESGLYKVDPYKVVTDPSTGNFVGVPEFTYYKLQKLGLKDAEIAKIPKSVLNQMKTADTGSLTSTSGIAILPTTAQEALQLPGERQIGSGLFVEVPLTAAQRQANVGATPNPAKDPWGYLLSSVVQKGEDVYTYLAKPEYKNGYKIEPTVAGLLTFNKIAADLSKPGATLDDVPATGGMSSYETFTNTLVNADPSVLADIGKKNPRLIIGASVDNSLQNILEAKMGNEFWNAVATGLSKSEYNAFSKEVKDSSIEKPMGDTFKGFVETQSRDTMPDLMPYVTGQLYQLGKDILIGPITPNASVNAMIAPMLILGKVPVVISKVGAKIGEKAAVLMVIKTAQGLSAVRDGVVVGSVIGDVKDASKFLIDGVDGSKIELKVTGGVVSATEVKAPTISIEKVKNEVISGIKSKTEVVPFTSKNTAEMPTKIIEFKKVTPDQLKAQPISALDTKIPAKGKVTDLKLTNEMDAYRVTPEKLAKMSSVEPTQAYVPLTSSDLDLVEDLGKDVYRASSGQKYVKYSKDKYLPVGDDYDPNVKGILSVESLDDAGKPNVVHVISSADSSKDVFHITYDTAGGIKRTISARPGTPALANADAMRYAQEYEDAIAAGTISDPAKGVPGATPQNVKDMQADMEQKLADINAQLDSEPQPTDGGGGGDYGGSGGSDGGSGGTPYTPPVATEDIRKWTMNSDWNARVRSADGGKTWEIEDPETLVAMSPDNYEKLVAERVELRRSKYDATTNTYKKIDKGTDGKWTVVKYQDSAGGWVTKSELDAERAAIVVNNPTFTAGVDGTARTRTNDATHVVQYLDEVTGNWITKDAYDALKGSTGTPIWNTEGGYYYFKNADGSFSIQNPWTNVKQTPDEYAQYLAAKEAAAAPVAPTQVQTYQTPSSYEAYTPSLQSNYAAAMAPVEARAIPPAEAADAWTAFTQTTDFDRIIKSDKDTQILVKAKDGKSLSAEEIDRALYLRSRMSPEGQAAFDLATGGETSANLMPMTDFENMITGNRAQIGTMTNVEIKASGLPPEKEIIVHQTKAEENLSRFIMSNEYQGASSEARKIINAELGYYAGEPSTVSNLLNKFNDIKKDWTIPTLDSWDKTVEALRSSKNLITDMPDWWKAENVDFNVSDLVLGNNKYSDIIVGEKAKGPTKYAMEKAYQKAFEDGLVIGGDEGYQSTRFTYKKLDGWVVRSPDGKDISFVAKNDIITTADEAITSTRTPLDMYFWENPVNVSKEFKIPNAADGSIIEAVTKVDPFNFPVDTWRGLTDAGGLSKDMTKEFVKIDLRTPDGQVWSTIREADKSKAFTVGKKVDLFEQDAIRINGLSGTEIQAMKASDFREFIAANAQEIRNLPAEDLPYLTKYIDETRANLIDEIRVTEAPPVTKIAEPEISATKVAEAAPPVKETPTAPEVPTGPGVSRYTKTELDDMQAAWKSEFQGLSDTTFKDMVSRNMDDIEQLDIEKLGLNIVRKDLIRGEIKDRNFMRSLDSRVTEINNRVARSRADMNAGKKTKYAHIEEVKQGIEDKNVLLRNVEDIKQNFAERFGEGKITCGAGSGFAAGLGAGGKALTPLLTIAAAGGAGLATGILAMEGLTYKNNLVANFEAEQRAKDGNIFYGESIPAGMDLSGIVGKLESGGSQQPSAASSRAGPSPGAFTSIDQIDRNANYVTKSGNLYRGAEITDAELPYIIRKEGGQ